MHLSISRILSIQESNGRCRIFLRLKRPVRISLYYATDSLDGRLRWSWPSEFCYVLPLTKNWVMCNIYWIRSASGTNLHVCGAKFVAFWRIWCIVLVRSADRLNIIKSSTDLRKVRFTRYWYKDEENNHIAAVSIIADHSCINISSRFLLFFTLYFSF